MPVVLFPKLIKLNKKVSCFLVLRLLSVILHVDHFSGGNFYKKKITVYTVRRQTVTEHSLCDKWGYSMEAIYSGLD